MKSLDKSFYHNIQLSSVRMISLKSNINLNCNDNNVDVKESGCKITIDGEDIIYIDDNKKRETVDIATYNIDKSLFYELKVGPTSFDYHVIEYLKLLNRKICEKI